MARKIIFKENGLLNSSNTPTGYRYIGYDELSISEKFGSTISAIGGGGGYVESVSGDIVDNTDPLNPIINVPTSQVEWLLGAKEFSSAEILALTGASQLETILTVPFGKQLADCKVVYFPAFTGGMTSYNYTTATFALNYNGVDVSTNFTLGASNKDFAKSLIFNAPLVSNYPGGSTLSINFKNSDYTTGNFGIIFRIYYILLDY